VKDLLKHKFLAKTKKASILTELIDRRDKWITGEGEEKPDSSSEEKDKDNKDKGGDDDGEGWDFSDEDKPKQPGAGQAAATKPNSASASAVPSAANSLQASDKRKAERENSTDSSDSKDKKHSSRSSKKEDSTKSSKDKKPKKDDKVDKKKSGSTSAGADAKGAGSKDNRPTPLTSIIYPALAKLAKGTKDANVNKALENLRVAFDAAEEAQNGITHQLIAQIIETLKRFVTKTFPPAPEFFFFEIEKFNIALCILPDLFVYYLLYLHVCLCMLILLSLVWNGIFILSFHPLCFGLFAFVTAQELKLLLLLTT